MKKTIRRIVLILAVILVMVSLTGCKSNANVKAQVNNDGNAITIWTDKTCFADILISLSTGESFALESVRVNSSSPTTLTLSKISKIYFNESFEKYVMENSLYISEVSVTSATDVGILLAVIFVITVVYILLAGLCCLLM